MTWTVSCTVILGRFEVHRLQKTVLGFGIKNHVGFLAKIEFLGIWIRHLFWNQFPIWIPKCQKYTCFKVSLFRNWPTMGRYVSNSNLDSHIIRLENFYIKHDISIKIFLVWKMSEVIFMSFSMSFYETAYFAKPFFRILETKSLTWGHNPQNGKLHAYMYAM